MRNGGVTRALTETKYALSANMMPNCLWRAPPFLVTIGTQKAARPTNPTKMWAHRISPITASISSFSPYRFQFSSADTFLHPLDSLVTPGDPGSQRVQPHAQSRVRVE